MRTLPRVPGVSPCPRTRQDTAGCRRTDDPTRPQQERPLLRPGRVWTTGRSRVRFPAPPPRDPGFSGVLSFCGERAKPTTLEACAVDAGIGDESSDDGRLRRFPR